MSTEQNFDLFDCAPPEIIASSGLPRGFNSYDELDDKVQASKTAIKALIKEGKYLLTSTSFGKDSAILLALALEAVRECIFEGVEVKGMAIITCDTKVENPVMHAYVKCEVNKVRQYIRDHNLPIEMHVAKPSISADYLVNMIGGRTVASFPDAGRKCTNSLKITPIDRLKKKVFKSWGVTRSQIKNDVIVLIGKRFDESEERRRNMEARGERPDRPIKVARDKNGTAYEWVMSPIAQWTLDDVFYYIAKVTNNMVRTYSDFHDLTQIYRDANSGECMINVYANGKPGRTACGSSTGCYLCFQVASDKSLANMISDPKHSWMKPLNDFRNFIAANHYKLENRTFIPRNKNDDGTVTLSPVAYSPEFSLKLLRIALTIDVREREEAQRLGIEPRFEMLSFQQTLAIETLWSRYAYQNKMVATATWYEINTLGKRYDIPEIENDYPRSLPDYPQVDVPFTDRMFEMETMGFRDLESFFMDETWTPCMKGGEFEINYENSMIMLVNQGYGNDMMKYAYDSATNKGTVDLMDLEYDTNSGSFKLQTIHFLAREHILQIYKGSHGDMDRMMRMANQVWRKGIRKIMNDPWKLIKVLASETAPLPKSGLQITMDGLLY